MVLEAVPCCIEWEVDSIRMALRNRTRRHGKHSLQQLRTIPSTLILFKLKLPAVGNAAFDKVPHGSLQLGFILLST